MPAKPRRITPLVLAPLVALLALPSALAAQETRTGGEIQVNTYTTGDQQEADLVVHADGSFVAVWEDPGRGRIDFRRFGSDGSPLGAPQRADSSGGAPAEPAVAIQSGGGFLAAWTLGTDVEVRRFQSDGTGIGPEFEATSITTGYRADVGSDDQGDFVVVWQSPGNVQARLFSSLGNPAGPEFDVETEGGIAPRVAVEPDGDFVVAWHDNPPKGGAYDVWARRFTSNGTPATGVLPVNTETAQAQRWAAVGVADDGDFVVVWNNASGGYDVRGQRFASAGSTQGGELILSTTAAGGAFDGPSGLAVRPDGSVVAWESNYGSGELFQRQVDASGNPLATGMMVNTATTGAQVEATVAPGPNGSFVVAWTNEYEFGDGGALDGDDSRTIRAQRYGDVEPPLFADGFETGDTSQW